MAAPTTTACFLDVLRKSQLLTPEQLDAALVALGSRVEAPPEQLVQLFIEAGLLTQFQARFLLQGKTRGYDLGKYRILEKIGSGTSGTVYLCEHRQMQRRVAVKVLPNSRAQQSHLLARFHREARAAALLDHPNLVRCLDVDQEGAVHFLVMDYVDGASLEQLVQRGGPLSVPRACHYLAQAAQGLHHAHQHGLIHRDVKPANILVDRSGLVKVLDLGLARFLQEEDDLLTVKYDGSKVLGSADFISPEQTRDSHRVDSRTDIYSLGATLYYALTGRTLFAEEKVSDKLLCHQVKTPIPVDAITPNVPKDLVRLIDRMLAKHPDDRPESLAVVADRLSTWTQEPVAPPDPGEMPQLCRAAQPSREQGGQLRSRELARLSQTHGAESSQTPTHPEVDPPPIAPSRVNRERKVRPQTPPASTGRWGLLIVVLGAIIGVVLALTLGGK